MGSAATSSTLKPGATLNWARDSSAVNTGTTSGDHFFQLREDMMSFSFALSPCWAMPSEPTNKELTKVINLKEFMLNNLRLSKQMPTLEHRTEKFTDQSTYAPPMIVIQVLQAQLLSHLISNRMEKVHPKPHGVKKVPIGF